MVKTLSPTLLLTALLLGACGYVTSVPIGPDNPDEQGIRYTELRPILIVAGGTPSIKYIPDPTRTHALRFGAFLAKNDMTIMMSDSGALTSVKSNIDSTASVDGLLQIANTFTEAILPNGGAQVASGDVAAAGQVRIFDFVFAPDGTLVGLKELKNIPLGQVAPVASLPPPVGKGARSGPDIGKAGEAT